MKTWKEFSDLVDVYNEKVKKQAFEIDFIGSSHRRVAKRINHIIMNQIEKTIENFEEWKCGKLDLLNNY